jgi:hypothetical protein
VCARRSPSRAHRLVYAPSPSRSLEVTDAEVTTRVPDSPERGVCRASRRPLDERIKEAFNAGVEWAKTEGAKRNPVEDDADGEEIVMDENGPVKN